MTVPSASPSKSVGWIIHLSWEIPTFQLTTFLLFPSWPGHLTLDFRDTTLRLETWMCGEAQKICCCSTGRSQTAPGGLSWKGTSSQPTPKVLLTLPPGACVCGFFSKEFHPPGFQVMLWAVLQDPPSQGPRGCFSVCPVLKAWGNQRLGFLANSFLQQIFTGFLLCPHHSSQSCRGRQACG